MKTTLLTRHSLKTRITLATLAIFLASLWSLSFYASRMLRQDMERQLGEQQFSTASIIASMVNRELETRFKALELVARLAAPAMQEGPEAVQALIEQRPDLQYLFNGAVAVHDLDGTIIADFPVLAGRRGLNYMDIDVIAAALKEGRASVGKPIIGKTLKSPVFGMAVPIRDADGKVIGALGSGISLGIPNFLDQITRGSYGKNGYLILVSPRHRMVVTSSDARRIMEKLPDPGVIPLLDRFVDGDEGSGVAVNTRGMEILASAKGIPASGWYASVVLPTAEAFAPVQEMQRRMWLATLLLTLLAGALSWWVLKRQLAPLLDAARALSMQADSSQRLPVARNDEIGQLVGGFNTLLETLGKRESALQESEESLAITLNSIGDAVIATDTDGRVTRMNPTAERLTGWSLDEARGRPLSEVFCIVNAYSREAVADPVQRVIALGEVVGLANHTVLLARDGQEYQIADSAAPIRNAANQIAGVVLVFTDVTEQYRLEQTVRDSEEHYRTAFQTSPDAITITRMSDGTYLDINDGHMLTFGWSRDEIIGKTSREIGIWHNLDDRKILIDALQRHGGCKDLEVDLVAKNGRVIRSLVSSKAIAIKGQQCLLSVTRDITERKQKEKALIESERRFRNLFEKNSSVMMLIDPVSGAIIDANTSAIDFYGYTREQLLKLSVTDINTLPPQRISEERLRAQRGECQSFLFPHRLASGEVRDVEVHITPLESDGRALLFSIVNDVTARMRAEAELHQHRDHLENLVESRTHELAEANQRLRRHAEEIADLYDNAPCGYHSLAPDGTIIAVNQTELSLLGYSRDEYLRHKLTEFMTAESIELFRQRYSEFTRTGRIRDLEFDFIRKDGTIIPFLASSDMVRNAAGEFISTRSMLVDNSERKARDLKIAEMQIELARRADAAEAANQAKTTFLANMSHEIRTPMNAILGMANILQRSGVTPVQAERLKQIDIAAKHLLGILNDILDISKVEAGKFVLEDAPVSIAGLLNHVGSILTEPARAKGLRLEIECDSFPRLLQGDPTRLQQALLNYATNAIKFSEHGTVTLRAIALEESAESELVRFEVQDLGIGIPPEIVPRLFNAFEQADNSTTRKYGGTGLGLAITRRLAELMGGEIGVHSLLGVGSTFWFTARLSTSDSKEIKPTPAAANADQLIRQHFGGCHILIVDDEPVNRDVAAFILEETGLLIDTAEDGLQAVNKARGLPYQLILMDMQMPILDGLDATRQIRKLPGHHDTPILAMTANAFAEDKLRCLEAGMNDFLIKPFDPDRLFSSLLKWLERRREPMRGQAIGIVSPPINTA